MQPSSLIWRSWCCLSYAPRVSSLIKSRLQFVVVDKGWQWNVPLRNRVIDSSAGTGQKGMSTITHIWTMFLWLGLRKRSKKRSKNEMDCMQTCMEKGRFINMVGIQGPKHPLTDSHHPLQQNTMNHDDNTSMFIIMIHEGNSWTSIWVI